MRRRRWVVPAAVSLVCALGSLGRAQGLNKTDAYRVEMMLRAAYETVKGNYYDPTYHGLDLDARFRTYDDKIKTVGSMGEGFTVIQAFLDGLKDSHTYLDPPARTNKFDYGYRFEMVGDRTFVTHIRPETDAVGKVLAGDELLTLDGQPVTRANFAATSFRLDLLQPEPVTRLGLLHPDGSRQVVAVETKVVPGRQFHDLTGPGMSLEISDLVRQQEASDHVIRMQIFEKGDVMIWKVPTFLIENGDIDKIVSIAQRHQTLILDLRDNPGGLIEAMRRMVGDLFDRDVVIADEVTRRGRDRIVAKSRGKNAYTGKLLVLINSQSASSAELLARVVQLEKRGTVLGDRSAGEVMESQIFWNALGDNIRIYYAYSVTHANLLMTDGQSLEGVGVTPDTVALPTAADLAAGRDPVLAQAAAMGGLSLTAVAAGLLFPFEWLPF